MKRTIILSTIITLLCLSACNTEKFPDISKITGEYNGYTVANCAFFQDALVENETIVITDNGDGSASVKYTSEKYGAFSITTVQVTEKSGTFTLSGSGKAEMGMNDNISTYDSTFSGVISGDKQAELHFNIPAVMGGLVIDFSNGETPAE
ncbi:MAG: calycin-like domain-containing protein [Candidatus Aphodosoma sp.]